MSMDNLVFMAIIGALFLYILLFSLGFETRDTPPLQLSCESREKKSIMVLMGEWLFL